MRQLRNLILFSLSFSLTSNSAVSNSTSSKKEEIEEEEIDQLEDDAAMNDSEAANLLNSMIASGSAVASGSATPISGGYPTTPNPLPPGYNKDLPICQNCSTQVRKIKILIKFLITPSAYLKKDCVQKYHFSIPQNRSTCVQAIKIYFVKHSSSPYCLVAS